MLLMHKQSNEGVLYKHHCMYLQALPSVLAMVIFVWLVEQTLMRGEWRCVSMEYGELCVAVDGTPERLQWCANSLDTRTQVSLIKLCIYALIEP